MQQDTLIAHYESVNLNTYAISDYYVISVDSLIIEVTKGQEIIKPPMRIPAMEIRSVYNLRTQVNTTYFISSETRMLSFIEKSFSEEEGRRHAVEKMSTDSSRSFTLYTDSLYTGEVTLSSDIPNFHPLVLSFPELTTLPTTIHRRSTLKTLRRIITDSQEKEKLLAEFKLDLETFNVLDEEEIKQLPQEMFGMSWEEYIEWIKKMAESQEIKMGN